MENNAITIKQYEYILSMKRKLNLPDRMLNEHCRVTFGKSFKDIDKRDASVLIDEMSEWLTSSDAAH